MCIIGLVCMCFSSISSSEYEVVFISFILFSYVADAGVPTGSLKTHNDLYFHYHHAAGDTISAMDPTDLDLCALFWTVVAYASAQMDAMLPR